jgi:AhpD family alkylhydroperoxidase
MASCIEFDQSQSDAYQAMMGMENYLSQCSLGNSLLNLIKLHVSQINGCAFCIDMHWKDARAAGEDEQWLYGLSAWFDSPYYSDRERAALLWAETVTRLEGPVTEEVYEQVRSQFTDEEFVDLTWAVSAINTWNRVHIALRTEAGNYRPRRAEF